MKWLFAWCLYFLLNASIFGVKAFIRSNLNRAAYEPQYYTAAVYEHHRVGNWTTDPPSVIVSRNLYYFEEAARAASLKGADILVTSEYALIPFLPRKEMKGFLEEIPDLRETNINPCDHEEFINRPMLRRLSCMAKRYNIVIVANTGEIQSCTQQENPNCPSDNSFHYNTVVAFDRNGTILAKYSKEYLFFEEGMDLPQEPQNSIFTTDFGTFSIRICFDASFKHMVDDVEKRGVNNIIVSISWIDFMPLQTSVQYFQSWALGMNATLLVADNNNPNYGSLGSGIFIGGRGAEVYTFNPDGRSKLLISKIPKSKDYYLEPQNLDSSIHLITKQGLKPYDRNELEKDIADICDFEVLGYSNLSDPTDYRCLHTNTTILNSTYVKLTGDRGRIEACDNGICCSLEYESEGLNDSYYLGAHNGSYNLFDRYSYCEESCVLAHCDSLDGTSCEYFPLKSSTVFHTLKLQGNFTTKYIYPSVVKSGIRLAPMAEWIHNVIDNKKHFVGVLNYESSAKEPMLIAGLLGRCYDRDPLYKR